MRSVNATNNKAIVSSKGQIVIPKTLRVKLGIHAGNELLFKVRADGVIEIRQVARSIEMFFGRCKRKNVRPLSLDDIDQAIMQAVSENDSDTQHK